MEKLYTLRRMLSATLLLFLSVAVISSCSKDNDGLGGEGKGNQNGNDISFDDALVWEYFDINEDGKTASATHELYGYPANTPEKWNGKVVIPSSVTIEGVEYSVTGIGTDALYDCKYVTAVKIPESVTSIGASAFSGCSSLTYIKMPNSVTSIGGRAFAHCTSLPSIEFLPSSVTSIGYQVFIGCSSFTSIKIPNSVTSIGDDAFSKCTRLVSIEIPNSVTSIGVYAFDNCSSLSSIEFPNSVKSIGGGIFYRNYGKLKSIVCRAENVPNIRVSGGIGYSFGSMSGVTLYVPASAVEKYKADKYWNGENKFKDILPIEE